MNTLYQIINELINNWPVLIALALTEISLSGDNALVNASLATALPLALQRRAVFFGIAIGAILRVIALGLAVYVAHYPVIQLIGGAYLIYLAVKSFFKKDDDEDSSLKPKSKFMAVMVSIAIADISFSLDNVVAAAGFSPYYSVVVTGVLIGILAMMFLTSLVLKLVQRYPSLEKTAFCIVGFIGVTIFLNILAKFHFNDTWKLIVILNAVLVTIIYEEIQKMKSRKLSANTVPSESTK